MNDLRCLKHRYTNHESAAFARRKLYRANRRNKSRIGALNIWFCESCQAYHIGHGRAWERVQNRQ